MKKLIFGIIVSVILIYFSIQGVEYEKILAGMRNVKYAFLIPTLLLILCTSFLRSVRWGVILSPIDKISQKRLFPITCIGYMALTLIPMRIGELLRPYLVSTKSQIPLSSALGTIFVERVLDLLTLLFILVLVVSISNIPEWIIGAGHVFLLTFVVLICILFLLYYKTGFCLRLFRPLLNRLPQKLNIRIEGLVRNFVEGFRIISNPKRFLYTIFLSVLIWVFSGLGVYCLFFFHSFHLSLISAFAVLVITVIGVSLPAAPGFLGNFQFACIMALSICGVAKSDAFAFSMVFYFLGIGTTILLGLVFLPSVKMSFKEIRQSFKTVS